MTAEEIDKLEPGRELDAAIVAETPQPPITPINHPIPSQEDFND